MFLRRITFGLVVLLGIAGFGPVSVSIFASGGAAWADDGGGDDGGGGSNSGGNGGNAARGGTGGGGTGNFLRDLRRVFQGKPAKQRSRQTRQATPQPAPRPARAPNEIVARDLSPEDTAALVTQGYTVLEEADLAALNSTVLRLELPDGVTLEEARAAIRALPTGDAADFNHYYRTEQDDLVQEPPSGAALPACDGLHCPARKLINWPDTLGAAACGAPIRLGMVDTGLNPDHESLKDADIDVIRIAPEDYTPSSAIHGTAIAAILVGGAETRAPGLLPGLPLVAVDAFHKQSGDERADAFTLVRSLDYLARNEVRVINLSLAGPPNDVLERSLEELTGEAGITVFAAAGNAGPNADPAYPAAYDSVIAVTAVDKNERVYRRAGRGPHVDLAAQGVDVWTAASVKGARWKTGTSFAVPYVTAAAALWLQNDPDLTPGALKGLLIRTARDLGPEGRDEIYGYGLVDLGNGCPDPAALLPASLD